MQGRDDHVVLPAAVTLRERFCVQDVCQFSVSVARSDYTVSVTRYHARFIVGGRHHAGTRLADVVKHNPALRTHGVRV